MSNKICLCIYTEGATDLEFYNRLLDYIKSLSPNKQFAVDKIIKKNIQGIGNFKTKLMKKFKNEVVNNAEFKGYKKIVALCYDEDVFELTSQLPPLDRNALEKELLKNGADKVIRVVAKKSIEDIFLTDIESILKFLKIGANSIKGVRGSSGYEKLQNIYKKASKVYYKGEHVEGFVKSLDFKLICEKHCKTFQPLCEVLCENNLCLNKKKKCNKC